MDPIRGLADLTRGDWAAFSQGLVAAIPELTGQEFITIRVLSTPMAPEIPASSSQGFLGRLFGKTRQPIDPILQVYRMVNCLYCECGGPLEDGGGVSLTAEQQAAILGLGWAQAAGKYRKRWGYPNYCAYFPHEGDAISQPPAEPVLAPFPEAVDADRAARLVVDTLRGALGVPEPDALLAEFTR